MEALLEKEGASEGNSGLFLCVGITGGASVCINLSVRLNAYLCGMKGNGFGFNTARSDKCQCSL